MTNPTESGYYWVREEPGGSDRDLAVAGWEVMFWDATAREWWPVGLDYAVPSAGVRDDSATMHAWVGPLTPPEVP